MNQFYKKAFNAIAKEGIELGGRYAGNLLLDALTKQGQDEDAVVFDKEGNPRDYADLRMQPKQTDRTFRKGAEELTPRIKREDLPKGYGAQTLLGPIVENPVDSAIFTKNIAPFAGLAVAGTALGAIFGGKPSSEYKVPVTPMTAYGNAMGSMNQNVISSNVSTMNAEYIENLKYKHQLDLIRAKTEARTPGVQMTDPSGRPALNEEVKEVARMLYGTGLKL